MCVGGRRRGGRCGRGGEAGHCGILRRSWRRVGTGLLCFVLVLCRFCLVVEDEIWGVCWSGPFCEVGEANTWCLPDEKRVGICIVQRKSMEEFESENKTSSHEVLKYNRNE